MLACACKTHCCTMKPYIKANNHGLSGELIVSKYVAESITMIAAIIVIDSATYLLTINSPDINKVAMSLYDINHGLTWDNTYWV